MSDHLVKGPVAPCFSSRSKKHLEPARFAPPVVVDPLLRRRAHRFEPVRHVCGLPDSDACPPLDPNDTHVSRHTLPSAW
jgi:hypothetical protein